MTPPRPQGAWKRQDWDLALEAKPTAVQLRCTDRGGCREHRIPQVQLFTLSAQKKGWLRVWLSQAWGGDFSNQRLGYSSF